MNDKCPGFDKYSSLFDLSRGTLDFRHSGPMSRVFRCLVLKSGFVQLVCVDVNLEFCLNLKILSSCEKVILLRTLSERSITKTVRYR